MDVASHLGVLITELSEQYMRFSQVLCVLLKTGPPTKGAAEPHEGHAHSHRQRKERGGRGRGAPVGPHGSSGAP